MAFGRLSREACPVADTLIRMAARDVDIVARQAAESLGDTVKARRQELDITQEELAYTAGISRNQVQNIEHSRNNSRGADGRPGPSSARLDTVFRLAIALRVAPTYLIDPERSVGDY